MKNPPTPSVAEPRLSNRDCRLVVALADGTLAGRQRRRAEKRLERVPAAAALLERQRRVSRILRGGPIPPPTLPQPAPARSRPTPRSASLPRVAVAVATFAALGAALAAALLLTVLQPAHAPPTIHQLAELGFRPALEAAPRSRPGRPGLITATFDEVPFPNWSHRFGWHTTGARSDNVSGRTTQTVYYGHMGHRIGYTIVSGTPLELPPGGHRTKQNGVTITVYGEHMHAIAVFERHRHTCVLAGHVAHLAKLVQLASWRSNDTTHS